MPQSCSRWQKRTFSFWSDVSVPTQLAMATITLDCYISYNFHCCRQIGVAVPLGPPQPSKHRVSKWIPTCVGVKRFTLQTCGSDVDCRWLTSAWQIPAKCNKSTAIAVVRAKRRANKNITFNLADESWSNLNVTWWRCIKLLILRHHFLPVMTMLKW